MAGLCENGNGSSSSLKCGLFYYMNVLLAYGDLLSHL
jgi:hypothetical protein